MTFALVFELVRLRIDGPTVDGVRLDGIYGVLMLIAGRGVDAILMLLPFTVGVGFGLVAFRRSSGSVPRHRWPGRILLTLGAVTVLALLAALLRPASTEQIATDGSIAELVDVRIGGHDQSILIRGRSADSPVLLYLEGGPGGTGIGRIRNAGTALEQNFVVAVWDQRGTGKSYDELGPTASLTVKQMVDDTLAVTDYLRERFGQSKIYMVGSSWGTTLGVLAVQREPEKFHAYVGTGQMVDQFATDELMYAESLSDAEARGDNDAAEKLRELGPPPYDDTLDYPLALSSNPKWLNFEHGDDYNAAAEYPASLFVAEYTLVEQLRGMGAIAETFHVLYPQLREIDFREQVPRLEVPVFVVQGEHEASGRSTLAREWFESLSAPDKNYVVFDQSGHTPPYDEPGRFAAYMRGVHDQVEGQSP
ncbi:alpha/beta fold hydrolase [Kribbella sindirgiensis]|uniref:alpha/beta fold hydrolase n=1 Tax=Kribbella sindirgiensis TaxID=1124744 RepID=UPI0013F4150E|nr:alpha/beta hydrolase [Kribbella sindirgiensis]